MSCKSSSTDSCSYSCPSSCSSEETCCVSEITNCDIHGETTSTQVCNVIPLPTKPCKNYVKAQRYTSCSDSYSCHYSSTCPPDPCPPEPCHNDYPCYSNQNYSSSQNVDGDLAGFNSVISPVTMLTPQYSPADSGYVQFRMRRKNKTITLQWEPFSGAVSLAGRNWIDVNQKLTNLPPYPMSFPLMIYYKGQPRLTLVTITPADQYHVKFYLALDQPVELNDSFTVPASSITWIVD